jgi:hypothetical protein
MGIALCRCRVGKPIRAKAADPPRLPPTPWLRGGHTAGQKPAASGAAAASDADMYLDDDPNRPKAGVNDR